MSDLNSSQTVGYFIITRGAISHGHLSGSDRTLVRTWSCAWSIQWIAFCRDQPSQNRL